VFFLLAAGLGGFAYLTYRTKLRRAKAIERGLKMVPILIHLPPPSSDTQGSNRDIREVMREKTAQAEVLYNLIVGTATEGFKSKFYGQRHLALELIAVDGVVHFFAAVPVALVSVVQKAIQTAYPGARLEQVEDHNIFNQEGRLAATLGGEMVLKTESAYPIATYAQLERDPMEALLTTISALEKKDGVAIQIMLRPADPGWVKRSVQTANNKRKGRGQDLKFTALDLAKAAVKSPDQRREEEKARLGGGPDVSNLQLSEIESIEEKTKHPGFEVLIRVIVSTQSVARSQQLLRDISTAFALFEKPGLNGFKFLPALDVQGLVTAFIFRFFPAELRSNVLNSVELATLFHLPDSQFTPAASIERQKSKEVDGPVQLSPVGLLFGYNDFRGVKKEIRLSPEDRRRHTYILGQTGTGKSTMLENLAVQDMIAGNGFAFIDPHGDSAEKLLAMVPKERAEDVIYFNPADLEYPLGLNLFEFKDPSQKDFIVQETINMLYKLYDPGHTGIIGPRYEHWYRNAALTLMSDPNGSTFIEIPKVFTDTEYLKQKFKYLKDPTVIDFWTKEMGQTSDYHKSEMLGWFVSKFGAFQNNEMMRNIIGQTKSSFNLRDVMDNKKILIVNLSKGRLGELNSQLLGMIFVIKFQAAAMSRADVMEDQRADFSLYVDEFQNFSTDSFASILSEARKYRLNLVVANQFIGQLSNEIRDAVFGNIGSIVAHRMGPDDAEFMVKQFAPVFDASDLMNIPNYNAAMRLMIGGLPSQPFSIKDLAPLSSPNLELGLAIKQLSAAKYGHARAEVEASIIDRFSGQPVPEAQPISSTSAMPFQLSPSAAVAPVSVPAPSAVMPAMTVNASMPAPMPVTVQQGAPMPAISMTDPSYPGAIPMTAQGQFAPAPSVIPVAQPPIPGPAFNAVPVPAQTNNISSPPPIDAAPVPLNPLAQPLAQVAPIIPEFNPNGAADQMILEGGFSQAGPPQVQSTPVVMASSEQPAAPIGGMATLPPPIGAPPVDLSNATDTQPVPAPASVPPPDPSTLSLSDITGGKVPTQASPEPSTVPLMEPGTELLEPALAPLVDDVDPLKPFVGSAVSQPAPLGSGQALEDDPYANIEVLGDFTAPAESAPMVDEVSLPSSDDTVASPLQSGQPLASDPYANIDVLGGAAGSSSPAVAAPAPSFPTPVISEQPDPVVVQSVQADAPVTDPIGVYEAPVVQPAQAPVQIQPNPQIASLPIEQPRVVTGVPNPVAPSVSIAPPASSPSTSVQMVASPVGTMPATPMLGTINEPLPLAPATPILEPPQPIAAMEPAPVVFSQPTYSTPNIPEATSVIPAATGWDDQNLAAEPAASTSDDSLIHFVDPAAQSILNRPEAPDSFEPLDEQPSLSGLPDGVQILSSTPPSTNIVAPTVQPLAAVVAPAPVVVPATQPVITPPIEATPVVAPPIANLPTTARVAPPQVTQPDLATETPKPLANIVAPPAPVPAALPAPVVSSTPTTVVPAATPPHAAAPIVAYIQAPAPAPAPAPIAIPVPAVISIPVPDLTHKPAAEQPLAQSPKVIETPVPHVEPVLKTPIPVPAPAPDTKTIDDKTVNMPPAPSSIVAQANVKVEPIVVESPQPTAVTPPKIALSEAPLKEQPKAVTTQVPVDLLAEKPVTLPESNASLVEALKNAPVKPEPVVEEPLSAPTKDVLKNLESVAEMLEEAPNPKAEADAPREADVVTEDVTKNVEKESIAVAASSDAASSNVETVEVPPIGDVKPLTDDEKSVMSPDAQIEKAEHEIDDLLSTSLIHEDPAAAHRRLPEPVVLPDADASESAADLEANVSHVRHHNEAPVGTPQHMAEHHGLKIIQPLEPIVPPKEQFAKELADLDRAGQTAESAPVAPKPVPEPVKPVPAPIVIAPTPTAPVSPEPLTILKHTEEMLPPVELPASEGVADLDSDTELPEPQSLAANDVAKLRAEREAQAALPKPLPLSSEGDDTSEKNEPLPAAQPANQVSLDDDRSESKRRRKRHGNQKREQQAVANNQNSTVKEPVDNKPIESDSPQSAVPGKLILPTGKKPSVEAMQPVAEKPKKLAPGEVYVDQNGNVVIGE
jgi:hypothetical protein